MTYLMFILMTIMVVGFVGVAAKPSPIYAGLGLIVSGGVGCGLMMIYGSSYMGLMVFLIYLGGMLVVFGYTTAMATEEYPEAWSSNIWLWMLLLLGVIMEAMLVVYVLGDEGVDMLENVYDVDEWVVVDNDEMVLVREDSVGVGAMYSYGSWLMVVAGWSLFVGVFIIVEVTRGV
uniref:NADH dehydrogenase subunit 6 n=1 Tax=Dipodomys spectabilis TaxID=105255 RepID=UPI00226C9B16|nr:NADH dehydrogenase subunit 6 [Dipodomys spectabilis]UZH94538.1 NADH dehydrogenase subunit 6 [Dipodomys spectabilis]